MGQKIEKIVQEDLNLGTDMTWVTAPGGGELRSTQVGLHSFARGQKEYTATWAPGAITAGSKASTTVTVPNAAVGDFVTASHDQILTSNLRIAGHVSAANTAKVVIHNPTASSVTVASGTVSVLVFPSIQGSSVVIEEVQFSWLQGSESTDVAFGFNIQESYLGSDSSVSITWDWGDGTNNTYTATDGDLGPYSKTHTYSIPPDDTFTVTLTVTSDLFSGYGEAEMTTNYSLGQNGSS